MSIFVGMKSSIMIATLAETGLCFRDPPPIHHAKFATVNDHCKPNAQNVGEEVYARTPTYTFLRRMSYTMETFAKTRN